MIITPHDAARLETTLRRETRSLLQYSRESFPWVRTGTEEPLVRLHQVMTRDRDAQLALQRFLTRHRHPSSFLGSFPMSFTTMNFVSLDWLLPRLLQEQTQALAALEHDRDSFPDGLARAELDRLVVLKRDTVRELSALADAVKAPATNPAATRPATSTPINRAKTTTYPMTSFIAPPWCGCARRSGAAHRVTDRAVVDHGQPAMMGRPLRPHLEAAAPPGGPVVELRRWPSHR